MEASIQKVLLINVPDFVDQWVLQSVPLCGDLIESVDVNPLDSSKMMLKTRGRENAEKIASVLDNYNLYGSIVRARYAFQPPPPPPNNTQPDTTGTPPATVTTSNSSTDTSKAIPAAENKEHHECNAESSSHATEAEHKTEKTEELKEDTATTPTTSTTTAAIAENKGESKGEMEKSQTPAHNAYSRRPGSKFKRFSRKNSRDNGTNRDPEKGPKTPPYPHPDEPDSRIKRSTLERSHSKDDPGTFRGCRFCHRQGHWTWRCQEYAEFYRVGETVEGRNPTGYTWPESSIVKVEGLHAGPIIEYFEKYHLGGDKLTREEIRMMFAWLLNFYVCHNCGAAGHSDYKRLCKYLPISGPVTEEMLAQGRRPFCRRMRGIRDHLTFGRLQQHARVRNNEFREWMKHKEGRDPKYSTKLQEDFKTLENNDTSNPPPPNENTKDLQTAETNGFVFAPDGKRIKLEPPDDNDISTPPDSVNVPEDVPLEPLRDPRELRRSLSSGNHGTEAGSTSASGSVGGTWAFK